MNASPTTDATTDTPIEDALAQLASSRRRVPADARAQRTVAAQAGAVALFEQIPAIEHLETLHIVRSSDLPQTEVVFVLYAPQGLPAESWDRLIQQTEAMWAKVEQAKAEGAEADLTPGLVNLFDSGFGEMASAIAASVGLTVRPVDRAAWHASIVNY